MSIASSDLRADLGLAFRLLWRSRLASTAFSVAFFLVVAVVFAAEFSPRQPATVALDVGISLVRLVLPLIAILQVQDLVAREVDRRLILNSLTYPRSRSRFLMMRFAAVLSCAGAVLIALLVAVALTVFWLRHGLNQPPRINLGLTYAVVGGYCFLDLAVIVAFATLLASFATSAHFVLLGGIGFALIARSIGGIIALLEADAGVVAGAAWYEQGLRWALWLVPDLGAMDLRAASLYDLPLPTPAAMVPGLLMAAGATAVYLILAAWIFERRQFS